MDLSITRYYININIKSAPVTPFDVDIDVVSGDGQIIQTWKYKSCEPTAYGTFLQEVIFIYQFVDQDKSEIRERVTFNCNGIELEVPETE